jgi:hypothetical protein
VGSGWKDQGVGGASESRVERAGWDQGGKIRAWVVRARAGWREQGGIRVEKDQGVGYAIESRECYNLLQSTMQCYAKC